MNIYYILNNNYDSIEQDKKIIEGAFGSCHCMPTLEEFFTKKPEAHAIILAPNHNAIIAEEIKQLRRSNDYFLTPILMNITTKDAVDSETVIIDETLEDINHAKNTVLMIQENISQINLYLQDWRSRLLYFLFTRPNLTLKSHCNWQHEQYYYYPLIKYFTDEVHDQELWLNDLCHLNILKQIQEVDQLFCCPYCYSAHLKFTEHCPNCNSRHIQSTDFLHCFTCGLIAPQNEFAKGDRLICPKCNSILRHIGEDYDRPLETGLCLNCNEFYMDATLQATCMLCQKSCLPTRLRNKKIFDLTLTEEGRKHVQFNTVNEAITVYDSESFNSQEFFYAALNWLISMQLTYKNEYFSLLGIYLPPLIGNSLISGYEFVQELKLMLRKFDLVGRLNENYIWIIFPKSNEEETASIVTRIKSFINDMNPDDQNKEKIKYIYYTSSAETLEDERANLLIAKLTAQL